MTIVAIAIAIVALLAIGFFGGVYAMHKKDQYIDKQDSIKHPPPNF